MNKIVLLHYNKTIALLFSIIFLGFNSCTPSKKSDPKPRTSLTVIGSWKILHLVDYGGTTPYDEVTTSKYTACDASRIFTFNSDAVLNVAASCAADTFTMSWTIDANNNLTVKDGAENIQLQGAVTYGTDSSTGKPTFIVDENNPNAPGYDGYIFTFIAQ